MSLWAGAGHGEPRGPVPVRIVSLTAALTDTLFALGVGDRIVGVSDECDAAEPCGALPRVGSFVAPVVERVLSLRPDLVLTSPTPGNRNAVEAIERAGVRTTVVTEGSASLEDVRAAIRATAAAVARDAEGERLLHQLDAAVREVERRVANRPRRRTAVLIGVDPLVLAGRDSYLGELVRIAGGDNVADAVGGRWPRLGVEFLLAEQPEVLIDLSGAHRRSGASVALHGLERLAAVRSGRVYRGSDSMLRPSPRLTEAVHELARDIHPEAWEAVP